MNNERPFLLYHCAGIVVDIAALWFLYFHPLSGIVFGLAMVLGIQVGLLLWDLTGYVK